jgi:hypothetical protein
MHLTLKNEVFYLLKYANFDYTLWFVPECVAFCKSCSDSETTTRLSADKTAHEIIWDYSNSATLLRNRTMQTEPPPLIGEFSSNFCG